MFRLTEYVNNYNHDIADFLTLFRFIVGIILLLFIFFDPHGITLTSFILLVLISWISDALDGHFARMNSNQTRLGTYDKYGDLFIAICCHLYILRIIGIKAILSSYFVIMLIITITELIISRGNSIVVSQAYMASIFGFLLIYLMKTNTYVYFLWFIYWAIVIYFDWRKILVMAKYFFSFGRKSKYF